MMMMMMMMTVVNVDGCFNIDGVRLHVLRLVKLARVVCTASRHMLL